MACSAEGDELDVPRQFLAKRGSLVAAVEAHRFAEQAGADAESGRQGRVVRFVHRCRLPRGKEVRAQLDSQAVIRHILELILYRSMYLYRYFLSHRAARRRPDPSEMFQQAPRGFPAAEPGAFDAAAGAPVAAGVDAQVGIAEGAPLVSFRGRA